MDNETRDSGYQIKRANFLGDGVISRFDCLPVSVGCAFKTDDQEALT
jgi:hypothetical protein